MIEIDSLERLPALKLSLFARHLEAILSDVVDTANFAMQLDSLSLTEILGGPIRILEDREELREVRSFSGPNGARTSLLDTASGDFDIAEWIEGGTFARFVAIDNPAGGTQYLVPRRIADTTLTVAESIRLHHAAAS